MSQWAIRAEGLSKRYRIGGPRQRYRTLREGLVQAARAPFDRLRHIGQAAPEEEIVWALRQVSFNVDQGEVLGIIGRNGAGKSTLLKLLARITRPTGGQAQIRGRIGSLLEVGTGFHPELTGRDNIYLNGTVLGMHRGEVRRKFDAIAEFAEIEKFLDTPVKRYSSGMYMRLAFAVAAFLEPEILLVDEVLAVGDLAFQKKCLGRMGEVARSGRTVLFVSHNLAAVQQICQRGLLIHEGQLALDGPVSQVVSAYIGSAATSQAEVTLHPADHVTGLHGLLARRATLLNGVGGAFAVPWRQPVRLAFEFEAQRSFQSVSLGLGITTLEGVPVLTVHDTDQAGQLQMLAPGRYRAEVALENPLRVGMYNLILGAHDGLSKSSLFYIPNAIRLEVVHATEGEQEYQEHNIGFVNGQAAWQVGRLEAGGEGSQ